MSVDLRSRSDGDSADFDVRTFFESQLPRNLSERASLVAPGAAGLRLRPFCIETPVGAWTLERTSHGAFRVQAGAEPGGAHLRVGEEPLRDLVLDQITPMGFFSAGELDMPAGGLADFLDWWLVLRSALDERPIHAPGAVEFRRPDGGALDLHRSFAPGDPVEEMSHFLHEAGFLHLRGVFGESEMAAVAADMDDAAPSYREGDGNSWWAGTADGSRRLVRMQRFDRHSSTTAGLLSDERFLSLGRIPGDGHVHSARADNRIEALFKPIGVVQGISDVPWHKDCSLGRHSYECCRLTVGISVTGADARSGQLRVRPGSHRALVWPALAQPGLDLPELELPTRTGDVTVHLSCTLHMAQPPVDRERRVLYTGFGLPARTSDAAGAQARLRDVREKAHVTVSQPPGHRS